MARFRFLPGALLLGLAVAAQDWTLGGKVGVVQRGDKMVPNAAVSAECRLGDRLSWRTDLGAQFPDASDLGQATLQVPTNLLFHPLAKRGSFDPYLGPGANYSLDPDRRSLVGANVLVGFLVSPAKAQAFGLEWRWSWPDLVHSVRGQNSLALVGRWETQF